MKVKKETPMKQRDIRFLSKITRALTVSSLLMLTGLSAQAQVPLLFDGTDWLINGGNISPFSGPGAQTLNGSPVNRGYNEFFNKSYNDAVNGKFFSDPGLAYPRWVWPFTRDISAVGTFPTSVTVDNEEITGALKGTNLFSPASSIQPYIAPNPPNAEIIGYRPLMQYFGANGIWQCPLVAVTGNANDYRSPAGGFAFPVFANTVRDKDYAYTPAIPGTFLVDRDSNVPPKVSPATTAEIALLPNATPAVYSSVHSALVASIIAGQPLAVWACGRMAAGRYGVDIYSPGNGTVPNGTLLVDGLAHSNVTRALVRVSWGNPNRAAGVPGTWTVGIANNGTKQFNTIVLGNGNADTGGINDAKYSRIFVVDLGESGWIHLQGGGLSPASFPFSGAPSDMLTVSIFALTPDDVNGAIYGGRKPVVVADAVRFVSQSALVPADSPNAPISLPPNLTRTNAPIFTIAPYGRVLASASGTNKIDTTLQPSKGVQPLFYVVREEATPEIALTTPPLRSYVDPTKANSGSAADPTALTTIPVFYCLDNRNGDTTFNGAFITSIKKVVWRYAGLPDSNSGLTANTGGGTSSVSPLLANVRCRDGNVRPMIYFATTSANGSAGHVYSLDPYGDPATQTTTAYWTYPSYRPLEVNHVATLNAVSYDPNYTGSLKGIYPAPGSGFGAAADQANTFIPINAGSKLPRQYYDGDLIPDTNGKMVVKGDTQIDFGGVQGAPILIEDPDHLPGGIDPNPFAPQLLLVPNANGRVFAFDAGGRGDFTLSTQTGYSGTTQRIWTWPRPRGDYYHADKQIVATAQGYTAPNPYVDDANKVSFPSSLSFNPANGASSNVFASSGDGHVYGLYPGHDKIFINFTTGAPPFLEKLSWLYPEKGNSLGAAPSTPVVFKGNLYFTCSGRVYSVAEAAPAGTAPVVDTLTWVYPWTSNPPQPVEGDTKTTALDPGFRGSAPLLWDPKLIDAASVLPDVCYVVQNNGTVYALNASPTGPGTTKNAFIATGNSSTGANTNCTPTATLLTAQPGFATNLPNSTTSIPALVFGDDDGILSGFALNTIDDGSGMNQILPLIWQQSDPSPRSASVIAVGGDKFNATTVAPSQLTGIPHGMLVEGDELGQMRAYGIPAINPVTGQASGTTGPGEPSSTLVTDGTIDFDIRGVNLYTKKEYDLMALNNGSNGIAHTPAVDENGAPSIGKYGAPEAGNLTAGPTGSLAVDWGEKLYAVAWGVYHGQDSDPMNPARSTGRPAFTVTFRMAQSGSRGATIPSSVPGGIVLNNGWPGDVGSLNAPLSIWGIQWDVNGGGVAKLTGNAQNVFTWVAKAAIPIDPTANLKYSPRSTNYPVTVTVSLAQTLAHGSGGNSPALTVRTPTITMNAGQLNFKGKSATLLGATANQANLLGQPRSIYITNPLALTVRGWNNGIQMGSGEPNIIGMGPDINSIVKSNPQLATEVLGNGNANSAVNTIVGTPKALFAPLPMTEDGKNSIYQATGATIFNSLMITDRSKLFNSTGRRITVQTHTQAPSWRGGPTSVMNPLPWEKLPSDGQNTIDYPVIPSNAISMVTQSGQELNSGQAILTDPRVIPDTNNPSGLTIDLLRPTPVQLSVNVPKFQPANVNRGQQSYTYNGTTYKFGSTFTDIHGTVLGLNNTKMVGPMNSLNGTNSTFGYPAGGYLAEAIVRTVSPGVQSSIYNPQAAYDDSRSAAGTSVIDDAYRAFELGLSVAPNVTLNVGEQTIHLGKLPQGTGYSAKAVGANAPPYYLSPFAPSMPGAVSPWDDPAKLGVFFQPFTLVSTSNINLVDLRIAKLLGAPNAAVNSSALLIYPGAGNAISAQLVSDQVNRLSNLPLFAVPFVDSSANAGLGNIGVVSSFDHTSLHSQPGTLDFKDSWLWQSTANPNGIPNPNVLQSDISAAIATGLPANTFSNWVPGFQPMPTLHKPLPGDSLGTTALIPDSPSNATIQPQSSKPRIGMAIPLGTPSGTYSAPIFPFEDETPIQWREWLASSGANTTVGTDHDGILNVAVSPGSTRPDGTPVEKFAEPTFSLALQVREARITNGVTAGTLGQIDTFDPTDPTILSAQERLNQQASMNALPAVLRFPTATNSDVWLYFTTNRQQAGSPYWDNGGIHANAPYSLAYTSLPSPVGGSPAGNDFNFARTGNVVSSGIDGRWWGIPGGATYGLFPDLGTLNKLFPSTQAEAVAAAFNPTIVPPYLPGTRAAQTAKFASPATTVSTLVKANGLIIPDPNGEAWLFYQGNIDKSRPTFAQSPASQQTETRTFYSTLNGNVKGVPDQTLSFLNDPALAKLSPKPIEISFEADGIHPAQKLLYLFWHSGSSGQTSLYYDFNANTSGNMKDLESGWYQQTATNSDVVSTGDRKLDPPGGLVWQSDPYPVYTRVTDPASGNVVDAIDLYYTGTLQNRQTVEVLKSRYSINRIAPKTGTDLQLGALSLMQLPPVINETLTRVGATSSYTARDASWVLRSGNSISDNIQVDLIRNGVKYHINGRPNIADSSADAKGRPTFIQKGQFDPASGLVTYDLVSRDASGADQGVLSGGHLIVDTRSGNVNFPNITPLRGDRVTVSYAPQVMRVDVSRDETNIVRSDAFLQSGLVNDPGFRSHPAVSSVGNNTNPVAIIDRGANTRYQLATPQGLFGNTGSAPPVDRLWVLYHKSAASGKATSTIYYKAMRLMIRLPRPVMLTAPNAQGIQSVQSVTVQPGPGGHVVGPYEIDYARGRIYFTEIDEGNVIQVKYSSSDPANASYNGLIYSVAWGDEMSVSGGTGDETTSEIVMPTDSAVNEGQVAAFKDPFADKIWIFWTSTRASTTDLYYQTLSPQFYPNVSNEH